MDLKVFTFSPAWGLPTSGPFPLKLIKWLDLSGLPYRQVYEDNSMKGPKKKSPWIELDGEAIADSELIIETLAHRSGFDVDHGLTSEQRALSHAVRRMLEEHLHMIFEYELFVHPAGVAQSICLVGTIPKPMKGVALRYMLSHMKRQLHARGIARHDGDRLARWRRGHLEFLLVRGPGGELAEVRFDLRLEPLRISARKPDHEVRPRVVVTIERANVVDRQLLQ